MVHEEGGAAAMKTCLSSDRLETDFDAASDASSDLSFGYEFAQAEVMMKGMGNNGESHFPHRTRRRGVGTAVSRQEKMCRHFIFRVRTVMEF